MRTTVPAPAFWISIGAVVPFVLLAACVWLLPADLTEEALRLQLAYGAVNLSFLGAVHWGIRLQRGEFNPTELGWSVIPAALGWIAQLILPVPGLILQMLALWLTFIVDSRAAASGLLPGWYVQLRRSCTAVAVLSLGATLLAAIWG